MTTTHNLGFPRIGENRELKRSLEAYWKGEIDQQALFATGSKIRQDNWQLQKEAGLSYVPTGDFAWYDQVLTLSATVGNIPQRHLPQNKEVSIDTLFNMARGWSTENDSAPACAMTKWFNTNYHYLVPEFSKGQTFSYQWTQIIDETKEALALGHQAKPVLLGPLSYLWLGKAQGQDFDKLELLSSLLSVYKTILNELSHLGVEWVQIDEPILVLDLPAQWLQAFERCYHQIKNTSSKILLATYFGSIKQNLHAVVNLPIAGLHIDAVSAPEQLTLLLDRFQAHKVLSLGLINGRNIWKADLNDLLAKTKPLYEKLGERLWLAPSCSLLHCPIDLERETQLPSDIASWLSFAKEKLYEVTTLAECLATKNSDEISATLKQQLEENKQIILSRRNSNKVTNPLVRQQLNEIKAGDKCRQSPFQVRAIKQQPVFKLPLLPTTTIGSFPQTTDIRKLRLNYKNQQISEQEYEKNIQQHIRHCIEEQESLDIDVLVHGEAERNDMVEYFGEQLNGYAFTQYGWVQSYGSRCVKPPIIYGDVSRPQAMTVKWARYAQSLTTRPVKGMLTGPVTLLFWSFVRDDQPLKDTALQIALALRNEVLDLEKAGITMIQIDEPAFREGLPLLSNQWKEYLSWAVAAFKISSCGVKDTTQIHTHMCYSTFNDIIDSIAALDADVITIETSRSNMQLLDAFEAFSYPNAIGPGVYDIHSPNVPKKEWVKQLIEKAATRIPMEQLWVNPDCGLKTRAWPETRASLACMVEAAKELREKFSLEQPIAK